MVRRFLHAAYGPPAWKRLAYLLIGVPLGALGFAHILAMIAPVVGLAVVVPGVLWALEFDAAFVVYVPGVVLVVALVCPPWLAAGLVGARGLGTVHRALARRLLGVAVEPPAPPRPAAGVLPWIRAGLADPTGWRALLYVLLKFPLGALALAACGLWWLVGLAGVGYPWLPSGIGPSGRQALFVAGAVLLSSAPWITYPVLAADRALVRGLLRPTRTDQLRETRALAVNDSAAALRRIERDLHDGAQAQLVALAMRLDLAKEELGDGDTAAALSLIDTAHQGAQQAIAELRDLVRGIHPPVLDTGLGPALQTLGARSVVPVELRVDLPDRPSAAIETIVYFSAAELLANIAKHSHAGRATVALAPTRSGWLRLTVSDDGVGGARPAGGLSGLAHRVRTVDGRLLIDSPPGGPTAVTVDLPVRA